MASFATSQPIPQDSLEALEAIAKRHGVSLIEALKLCIASQIYLDAVKGIFDFPSIRPQGWPYNPNEDPGPFDKDRYPTVYDPGRFGIEHPL